MRWQIFRPKRSERDLDDEIRAHMTIETEQRIERGETHAEAVTNAKRDFGSEPLVKDVTRDAWRGAWWKGLGRDVDMDIRYAIHGHVSDHHAIHASVAH